MNRIKKVAHILNLVLIGARLARAILQAYKLRTCINRPSTRYIANGFIPDGFDMPHNGPRYSPFSSGARGDISGSEGMDAPNFWFNNSDNGASF